MRNLVVFFTIFLCGLALAASNATPPNDSVPDLPQSKSIDKQSETEGEKQDWAIETIHRREHIYPSNYGDAGIYRVRSAESLPEGALTFGIGGEFYGVTSAPDFGYGNTNANTIAEDLFVGYSPVEHLTISLMRRDSSTTFGNPPLLISSLGDIDLSVMYSFPLSPSFAVAPIGDFLTASNFNKLNPAGTTISAGIGGAATYTFYPATGIPLFLHANLIYHSPEISTSPPPVLEPEIYFGFSRYNTMHTALAAEYEMGDFIPFIEYSEIWELNSPLNFGNSPSQVSIGTRITPLSNKSLAVLVGMDIGVGRTLAAGVPFTPPAAVIGQLSYTVGLTNTERKHYYTTQDVNVVDRKFVIKKTIKFKVGKADLEQSSTALLDQIAEVIQENHVKKLLIAGHTDSTQTEEYNMRLSMARANAVKAYLVSRGIPSDVLVTQGFGKRKPIASNLTEEGRALNRRVEFYILE